MAKRQTNTTPAAPPSAPPSAPSTAKPGRPKRDRPTVANVNPDDIIACFSEVASIKADVARLGQRIAVTYDRYEKMGVDRKSIKHALARAQKDPAEVAAQHKRDTEYLVILEITSFGIDGQGDFSAGLTVTTPKPTTAGATKLQHAKISMDGYNSGLAGGDKNACRHHAGTQEHVIWLEAWHDGYADRIAKNPNAEKTKEASTSRKRRDPGLQVDVEAAETAVLPLVH